MPAQEGYKTVSCWRGTLSSIAHLGSGEFVGRLCAIATLAILGHRYGATVVGIFALAQGVAQYLQPLIDFGLRHTGARLVAKYPGAISFIVRSVQLRRGTMLLVALPMVVTYVFYLRVDLRYKFFILGFAACACLYALSLDWLAWGKERFRLVAFSRAVGPVAVLVFLIFGSSSINPLAFLFAGNALGQLLLVLITWLWWRSERQQGSQKTELIEIEAALRFRRTVILGFALLSNMAFNTVDILLLGVFSSPAEVGIYSAAYRIFNQALLMYYLLTQSLYPRFAKLPEPERKQMLRPPILIALFACGGVLTILFILTGKAIIALLFGPLFANSYPLLSVLAFSIPMDFITSYLSTAYVAWGMERQVLVCTATGAITNIGLNVAFMPLYGAKGAAITTVVSYLVFLVSLMMVRRNAVRRNFLEPCLADAGV
jgi:O-antigen/teichoic acid export membrane protein